MAEPVSSTASSLMLVAIALIALFPGIDAATVLGAFAGSSVFVLSAAPLPLGRRAVFFIASFITGCLAADGVARLLSHWQAIAVSPGVGAILAAALAVKLLQWLIRLADDPTALLRQWKGGKR